MENFTSGNVSTMAAPESMEPFFLRVFRLALYTMIFLIATIGNSLVIFVVYKTAELRTGQCHSYVLHVMPFNRFKPFLM